ncbi:MAG TPA: DUF2267 domain-containing protein [Patescibacteria group bacterium]|nr:DUF2267 domain-containing protein [Patescibacteria group bacterium]
MASEFMTEFEPTLQKTAEILKEIDEALGWKTHARQAYQALRAVLHVLRDRLPLHEAIHFGAQLPMLVRGFYYEGWDPEQTPKKMKREEFIEHVRKELPNLSMSENIETVIQSVFFVLGRHLGEGEMEKLSATMPHDIREMIEASGV